MNNDMQHGDPQEPLNDDEAVELDRHTKGALRAHRILRKHKLKLAQHLLAIHTGRLFRGSGDQTWEAFISSTFSFSADYAYKLVRSARVSKTVEEAGDDPLENEAQARAICTIKDPNDLLATVRRGREQAEAEGKKPTAAHFAAARKEFETESGQSAESSVQDHTATMTLSAEAGDWPWGENALAQFKKVPKVDRDAVRDALVLASLGEDVTAELVEEAAMVVAGERSEDGGRSGRLVVVGIAKVIVQVNRDALIAAARGESKRALQTDIEYVPGADGEDDRVPALPLLCTIPKGMCPDALLDAYPGARGSITAKTIEVVVELAELEKYGGPVKDGVLDIAAVREASRKAGIKKTFNPTGKLVGWARFTTNPSTGCDHGCSLRFCYASDLALKFYPQCFVPTIWPARLDAFDNTPLPIPGRTCAHAPGWDRSVFLGSMTDLMNRSFPDWWIEAVLGEIAAHPEWNVFVLTKIAARLRDFDFPPNAAVGVTVTTQREVAKAAAGLRAVRGGMFKWASVEPMLGRVDPGPLLDAGVTFIAVGGQSKTRWSGEKQPLPEDVRFLIGTAWALGACVYHKDNLDFRAHIPFPGYEPWTGLPDFGCPAGKEPGASVRPAPDRRAVPARGPSAREGAPSDYPACE